MKRGVRVWDLPLRLWHWMIGVVVLCSLITGWLGDLDYMEFHIWSGIAACGLLTFRLTWGLWGGLYARWRQYFTTPLEVFMHFRGSSHRCPHTAPGIALVVLLMMSVAIQVFCGMFTTDDIFFEGPLHRFANSEFNDAAGFVHRRLWWFIASLVGIHISAHFVYGFFLRDATPLSMITGRKTADVPATPNYLGRSLVSVAIAATVFGVLAYFAA